MLDAGGVDHFGQVDGSLGKTMRTFLSLSRQAKSWVLQNSKKIQKKFQKNQQKIKKKFHKISEKKNSKKFKLQNRAFCTFGKVVA